MLLNIQMSVEMEQATTSHAADRASNSTTRGLKSGLYALLPFCIVVGGCSVGPKYKAPATPMRPFHNPAPMRADGASAPPLDTWWEGFGDPDLTRIVQRALDQNLDLAASLTRVEQARAAAKEAGARLKPSGALSAQSTSLRQSLESPIGRVAGTSPGFDRNQSYLDLAVAASWEIDLFGGLRHGVEAASAEVQAAEAEHLGTRVSIVAEAADAYMQVRGAQARLTFAQEQISTDQHLLQLVSQRRAAGVASDREQAQAEAVLAQARATVPQLAIILEAQLNRLDVLMGVQPGHLCVRAEDSGRHPHHSIDHQP